MCVDTDSASNPVGVGVFGGGAQVQTPQNVSTNVRKYSNTLMQWVARHPCQLLKETARGQAVQQLGCRRLQPQGLEHPHLKFSSIHTPAATKCAEEGWGGQGMRELSLKLDLRGGGGRCKCTQSKHRSAQVMKHLLPVDSQTSMGTTERDVKGAQAVLQLGCRRLQPQGRQHPHLTCRSGNCSGWGRTEESRE